jgi:aryl-alcohol dehydrogenase-like predicted oxidoreductase
MSENSPQHPTLRAVGKPVYRLGIATNYGISGDDFDHAVARGVNYVFWTSLRSGSVTPALSRALKRDRSRLVVATGPTIGWFAGNYRRSVERMLKKLDTDYIDVFQLMWMGVASAYTESTLAELERLKREGKIRAIGTSIHDRERAGKLAVSSPIDLFMIRYNAAHPGAERDIFPHLAARNPSIVAYTATAWRKLLKVPSGWNDRAATPGECYRFCLSSPHVDVVLTGPANRKQLDENLDAVEKGPLSDSEMTWMRRFGKAAHG